MYSDNKDIEAVSKVLKRKNAWNVVFASMNGKEAVEWIEREFIKKQWLYV